MLQESYHSTGGERQAVPNGGAVLHIHHAGLSGGYRVHPRHRHSFQHLHWQCLPWRSKVLLFSILACMIGCSRAQSSASTSCAWWRFKNLLDSSLL